MREGYREKVYACVCVCVCVCVRRREERKEEKKKREDEERQRDVTAFTLCVSLLCCYPPLSLSSFGQRRRMCDIKKKG